MLFYFLKKIATKIANFFIFFLPKYTDPNKIIFFSYPDLSDNSLYLFNYINKNKKNLTLVWLVNNYIDPQEFNYKSKNKIIIEKRLSIKGLYHFLTSRYAFYTHTIYFFLEKNIGPVCINLWHGMPIKNIGFLENKKNRNKIFADFHISTSELYSSILSKAFDVDKSKILEFGLPRNDIISSHYDSKEIIFKKILNVNKKNYKLIIWLPTFRTSNLGDKRKESKKNNFLDEWDEGFFNKLNIVAKKHNIFIFIKLHPYDDLNKRFFKNSYSNIKIYNFLSWKKTKLDIYELLSISDGLISDISSVIIDYITINKPCALTKLSFDYFKRGLIKELDIEKNLNFINIINIQNFENFFKIVQKGEFFEMDPNNLFYLKSLEQSCKKITDHFKI